LSGIEILPANQEGQIILAGGYLSMHNGKSETTYDPIIVQNGTKNTQLFIDDWELLGGTGAGDSAIEFTTGFSNPGDCIIRPTRMRGDLNLADNVLVVGGLLDLGTANRIYSALGATGSGTLRGVTVVQASNATPSMISVASGLFTTAGIFDDCTFYGATNRDIAEITNSVGVTVFKDSLFVNGWGATNSIRSQNAQDVYIAGTLTSSLTNHANVSLKFLGTNYQGPTRVVGLFSASGVLSAFGGIDTYSDYVQRAGNITALSGVVVDFTSADSVNVPDDAYAAGWDGSVEVPTKNALYDKIEALTVGGTSPGGTVGSVQYHLEGGGFGGTNGPIQFYHYNPTNGTLTIKGSSSSVDVSDVSSPNATNRYGAKDIIQLSNYPIGIGNNGSNNWSFNEVGHLVPVTTNAHDIGSHLLPVRTNYSQYIQVKQTVTAADFTASGVLGAPSYTRLYETNGTLSHTIQAASQMSRNTTNIVGVLEANTNAVIALDLRQQQTLYFTNRMTHNTVIWLSNAIPYDGYVFNIIGAASGGTDYTLTLNAMNGQLMRDSTGTNNAVTTNLVISVPAGSGVEVNGKTKFGVGTNWHDVFYAKGLH
jgi:hypothetical protein